MKSLWIWRLRSSWPFDLSIYNSQLQASTRLPKLAKVVFDVSIVPNHKVLILDVRSERHKQRSQQVTNPRIKWWQLKGDKLVTVKQKLLEESGWELFGSANLMRDEMSKKIRKAAKEVLGQSRGFRPRDKESWWWNENVQDKGCNNAKNWVRNQNARNDTRKVE
ncbi:hypothetical protein CR513_34358, partial [Mucuna pruriens]